jgi:hypothetical protein
VVLSHGLPGRVLHREDGVLGTPSALETLELNNEVTYIELGADHFDRRNQTETARRLVKRLESLGLIVDVRFAA